MPGDLRMTHHAQSDTEYYSLEALGYNAALARAREELGMTQQHPARVISEAKHRYLVRSLHGERSATLPGKQRKDILVHTERPAVGDWVLIDEINEEQAVIRAILPRASILTRRHGNKNQAGEAVQIQILVANADTAFIVGAVDRDFSPNRFERYCALVSEGGVRPVIVLNKVDLISTPECASLVATLKGRFPKTPIVCTSTVTNDGLEELKGIIKPGQTYCFLGSSGVGKSTLVNTLLEREQVKTQSVSSYSGRGTHTTTAKHLYVLKSGGILIDSPGIREVSLALSGEAVDEYFTTLSTLDTSCKFRNCTHTHEPGCAVRAAAEQGDLDEEQYHNYLQLKAEAEQYAMPEHEKRRKGRELSKLVKQVNTLRRGNDV